MTKQKIVSSENPPVKTCGFAGPLYKGAFKSSPHIGGNLVGGDVLDAPCLWFVQTL